MVQVLEQLGGYNSTHRVDGFLSLVDLFPSPSPSPSPDLVLVLDPYLCPSHVVASSHNCYPARAHDPIPSEAAHPVVEAHQLQVSVDVLHVLAEAGAEEGQRKEDDVVEVFHGHARGRGHDDGPCFPNDRVHARPREENLAEWPWVCGPLFPVPFLSPCPCPCLDLARVHGPCLLTRGQGQAQTKERE